MSKQRKFKVYLAGPISGCNRVQVRRWREEIEQKYDKDFECSDPSKYIYPNEIDSSEASSGEKKTTPSQIVEADLSLIGKADGLLANMWRESIGTAIGIVHANLAGKPVVVADPNHLGSKTLAFYADRVEETPLKAATFLRKLLRTEAKWSVLKSSGRVESFNRRKLMDAIRSACRNAKCDDVVGPRLVSSKVIGRLQESSRSLKEQFPTTQLDDVIREALKELENDFKAIEGVLSTWERLREEEQIGFPLQSPSSAAFQKPATQARVEISTGGRKNHATIWGKPVNQLRDIPSARARRVFEIIGETHGITRITLGPKGQGNKESRSSCKATVNTSKTLGVIEGKLFDPKGAEGTMQTFQVRVQYESDKGAILKDIIKKLEEGDLLA